MGTHLFNRYEDRLRAESGGYGLNPECRFLADTVEKLQIFLDGKFIFDLTDFKI